MTDLKEQEAPKGEGWVLVSRFSKYLQENEKSAVFWFLMVAFFYVSGIITGFLMRSVLG